MRAQKRGDEEKASRLFEQAVELAPTRLDFLLSLAKSYHRLFNEDNTYFERAEAAYLEFMTALNEVREHSLSTDWLQCDRFELGRLYLEAGAYQAAITSMTRAIDHCPDLLTEGEAVNAIGMGHYYLGNYDAAANYFYKAVENDPSLYVARYNLWSVKSRLFLFSYLSNSTKNLIEPETALNQINELRRIAPHYIEAVILEGKIHLEAGRLDEAYAHFANIVATGETGPQIDALRIEMIRILFAQGKHETAKEELFKLISSINGADMQRRATTIGLVNLMIHSQQVKPSLENQSPLPESPPEREQLPYVSGSHTIFNCEDCHGGEGAEEELQHCGGCHPSFVNIHPVGFIPDRELPQGFNLAPGSTMACATCHRLHVSDDNPAYLRFVNSADHSRDEFCAQCHGARLSRQNPHQKGPGKNNCVFCHSTRRESSHTKSNTKEVCNFCHGVYAKNHPKTLYFFNEESSEIDIDEDEWTCVTCHLPHGTSGAVTYLRPQIASMIERVRRRDPHLPLKTSCDHCHRMEAVGPEGELTVGQLRYEGDIGLLCTSCHIKDSGHHPVGVLLPEGGLEFTPSESDVGLNHQERIDCYTCHVIDCDGDDYRVMLRVEVGSTIRSDLCWNCHNRGNYVRRSPHVEHRRLCLHCHERVPSVEEEAPYTLDVPELVCDVCHEVPPHPYGKHLGNPSEKVQVPEEFPLGEDGQILCYSCHDPHKAELDPEDPKSHLRLREGVTDCSKRCHIKLF